MLVKVCMRGAGVARLVCRTKSFEVLNKKCFFKIILLLNLFCSFATILGKKNN